jgi:hypothetical protein
MYLGMKIYTLSSYVKFWIRDNTIFELFYGISREICEILYFPLWGIVIAFSILFFDYWINTNDNVE